jgi:hypothetical protein
MRVAWGATLFSSSSSLPAVFSMILQRPVTLPPGRARLAVSPVPTGSAGNTVTIGIDDVAPFCRNRSCRRPSHDDFRGRANQLVGKAGKTLVSCLRSGSRSRVRSRRSQVHVDIQNPSLRLCVILPKERQFDGASPVALGRPPAPGMRLRPPPSHDGSGAVRFSLDHLVGAGKE